MTTTPDNPAQVERPWLQTLVIQGEDVDSGAIDFSPGLTLIHGRSNTGKTYLADAIDYVFTAQSKPFEVEDTGYDTVAITAQTPNGRLQVSRPLRGTKARISSDDKTITSGDYAITRSERSPEESLSDIWLRQLGIDGQRRILTSAYANPGLLTWRRFSDTFYLSEDRIIQKKSIFNPGSTESLAALAVLLFDTTYEGYEQKEDPSDQKKRKQYMSEYIGERAEDLLVQYDAERETVDSYKGRDMKREFNEALTVQTDLTHLIGELRSKASTLIAEQLDLDKTKGIKTQERKRYEQLESKYVARIERLGLIVDGQAAHEHVPEVDECPFCHGGLPEEVRADYREAVQGELTTVLAQLAGLREATRDLDEHLGALTARSEAVNVELASVQTEIRTQHEPQLAQAQATIRDYAVYNEALGKAELLLEMYAHTTNDLREVDTEAASTGNFKPAELFPASFFSEMSQNCQDVLIACGYPETRAVTFSREDFDIRVGGKRKRSHGKGYRAFLNSVVAMALRKYIHDHAAHKPFVMIIDTPVLGLDAQPDKDGLVTKHNADNRPIDGLQAGLFQYFLDTQDQGQLIVVDNTKDTPALNYNQDGAREYVFTANEKDAFTLEESAHVSYGLLPALVPGYEQHKADQELEEQLQIDQWPEDN